MALHEEGLRPAGHDKVIAAFCRAVIGTLESVHPLGDALEESLSDPYGLGRAELTSANQAQLILRAVQKQTMRSEAGYPAAELFDATGWRSILMEVSTRGRAELLADLRRPLQSNRPGRYAVAKILLEGCQARIGDGPAMLDVGASGMLGLKGLLLGGSLTRGSCPLYLSGPRHQGTNASQLTTLDRTLNHAHTNLGLAVGLESEPPDADWLRASSFRPMELLNSRAVDKFDRLTEWQPADLHGLTCKFDESAAQALHCLAPGGFDLILFSTVLFMNPADQRGGMRELARSLLSPRGLIVYQDYARPGFAGIGLDFHTDWGPYSYRTMIEDPSRGSTVHELIQWRNSRCEYGRAGRDIRFLQSLLG